MTARFACLIPAFNEEARIGGVLRATVGHPMIERVLVVDDGSSDRTAEVARHHGAEVLVQDRNGGKTAALARGFAALDTSHVVLIDADLLGLRADHLTRLIAPVADGMAAVTLSLRGNAPWLWRAIGVDYISGERVIPRALVADELHRLPTLPRFGFEVFLNDLILRQGLAAAIVRWPDVASPSKATKRGRMAGLRADLAMLGDIFRTVGPRRTVVQATWLAWQAGTFAGVRPKPR